MISLVPNVFPATFEKLKKRVWYPLFTHIPNWCIGTSQLLQAEIKQLKQDRESSHPVSQKPCFLYVRLSGEIMSDGHLLGKSRLESLLGVEVSQYV